MKPNARFDVVVVGAGLSGLMCAAWLARRGASVAVLERASRVGGRALSPAVGDVAVNLGAHALYLGGPGERALRDLGVVLDGTKPSANDAWLTDDDGVFRSPTSVFSLLGSRQFSFGERMSLAKFFATLDFIKPASLAGKSTAAWLDERGYGPRARRFMDAMIRVSTYSNAPDVLPASVAVRQLQIAIGLRAKGVMYLSHGWQSIALQLEAIAVGAGARIETNAHAVHVAPGSVEMDGGRIECKHAIVALPRAQAALLVPEIGKPVGPPLRAACIDMTIDAPPERTLVFGLEKPHYFSVHSARTAHALRYLAPGEVGSEKKAELEAWLDRAVPDWRGHVVAQRFLPEMEVSGAFPAPPPALAHVSFASDWASEEHVLLDAAAASAETAVAKAA